MGVKDQGLESAAGRYLMVPRTLCFVLNGDDVLLMRRAAHKKVMPGFYNGVGGHVEPGEDILASMRREVREETGLDIHSPRLRAIVHIDGGNPKLGIVMFVFTAESKSRRVRDSEEGTLEWVPRARVTEVKLAEDLFTLLPAVLGMAPDDPPLFALYTYDERDRLHISIHISEDIS